MKTPMGGPKDVAGETVPAPKASAADKRMIADMIEEALDAR
jgi:hypothetical protein